MDATAKPIRKTIVKLSFKERLTVFEKLKEVLTSEEGGLFSYVGDWDDQKVADFLNLPGARAAVAGVRTEMFGLLKRQKITAEDASGQSRIAELEQRLTQVEDYLTRQNPHWKATLI